MDAVWSFCALYLVVLAASALALTALGLDIFPALAASASALGNVGLELGTLSAPAKIILILEMLLGRLEFFALLILFHPGFWTR
jgi:trk system potassium uptake protein TrkH